MRFRILGDVGFDGLEGRALGGRPLWIATALVYASLDDRTITTAELFRTVWGYAPKGADDRMQVYRDKSKAAVRLGGRLSSRRRGWHGFQGTDSDSIDAYEFERTVERALDQASASLAKALELVEHALALWVSHERLPGPLLRSGVRHKHEMQWRSACLLKTRLLRELGQDALAMRYALRIAPPEADGNRGTGAEFVADLLTTLRGAAPRRDLEELARRLAPDDMNLFIPILQSSAGIGEATANEVHASLMPSVRDYYLDWLIRQLDEAPPYLREVKAPPLDLTVPCFVRIVDERQSASRGVERDYEGDLYNGDLDCYPIPWYLLRGELSSPLIRRAVVLAPLGYGKSTLLQQEARDAARLARSVAIGRTPLIPVLLRCSQIASALANSPAPASVSAITKAILATVEDSITGNSPHKAAFLTWLDNAFQGTQLILLLDGLDEVFDPTLATHLRTALERFARATECVLYITSRPAGYRTLDLGGNVTVELLPTPIYWREELIKKWMATDAWNEAHPYQPQLTARQLNFEIEDFHFEAGQVPLFLTFMLLALLHGESLPTTNVGLYSSVVNRLTTGDWHPIEAPRPGLATTLKRRDIAARLGWKLLMDNSPAAFPVEVVVNAARGDHAAAADFIEHSGLLVDFPSEAPKYFFFHRSERDFLAARELATRDFAEWRPQVATWVWLPQWDEVLPLVAGLLGDPSLLIRELLELSQAHPAGRHIHGLAVSSFLELPADSLPTELSAQLRDSAYLPPHDDQRWRRQLATRNELPYRSGPGQEDPMRTGDYVAPLLRKLVNAELLPTILTLIGEGRLLVPWIVPNQIAGRWLDPAAAMWEAEAIWALRSRPSSGLNPLTVALMDLVSHSVHDQSLRRKYATVRADDAGTPPELRIADTALAALTYLRCREAAGLAIEAVPFRDHMASSPAAVAALADDQHIVQLVAMLDERPQMAHPLALLAGPTARDAVLAKAESADPSSKHWFIDALGLFRAMETEQFLVRELRSSRADDRVMAAWALIHSTSDFARDALMQNLERDPDPDARAAAASALAVMGAITPLKFFDGFPVDDPTIRIEWFSLFEHLLTTPQARWEETLAVLKDTRISPQYQYDFLQAAMPWLREERANSHGWGTFVELANRTTALAAELH